MEKRFHELAVQIEDLLQMSEIEHARAEDTALAIQTEFDQAMQRLDGALDGVAEAVQEDHFVDGEYSQQKQTSILRSSHTGAGGDYAERSCALDRA
jgi:hypothetical protein